MTTSAEMIPVFEHLAERQRNLRASIIKMNGAAPLGDLQLTIDEIDRTIAKCEDAVQALRNGEAFTIDDIVTGGIEGPFETAADRHA